MITRTSTSAPPVVLPRVGLGGERRARVRTNESHSDRSEFLSVAFRPFYLCGTLAAVIVVPIWLAVFLGVLPWRIEAPRTPMLWHAHEMIFGFAGAIIVGFLFTAGARWTGRSMPSRWLLAAFVGVWFAARVSALMGPYQLHAFIDTLLFPAVACVLAWRLLEVRQYRNLPIVAILLALTMANIAYHLTVMRLLGEDATTPLRAALSLLVMLETIIGGRIIPPFHMAVCRGLSIRPRPTLDRAVEGFTLLSLASWILQPESAATWMLCGAAALLQAARMILWKPWAGRRVPMLWILSLSYAFIPVGLALLSGALATAHQTSPLISVPVAEHAFAVGATGGLILGMMCRSARGHTGRMIHASRVEVVAFALVLVGALIRVAWPVLLPVSDSIGLIAAGALWCGAFGIFLLKFAPWLIGPSAREMH